MSENTNYNSSTVRKSCRDIWNAFMVKGAVYTAHDIPFCPTTATEIPKNIINYQEAEELYRKSVDKENFYINAYVCFYIDDYKFDMGNGVWFNYRYAAKVLSHFAGIITPDFSTNQDFAEPLKLYNTYRMRAFGYWYGKILKRKVYNNVRWGTKETYEYCFNGIPTNSIVAIGTCGGNPKMLINRKRFEDGLFEMVRRLSPHTIIVYGSAKYTCFDELRKQKINIIEFPSKTAKVFDGRKKHE